ncbi:MAG TPA: class I SAM-dependent methyltransferase [Thermoanaerobaculia bacterium]|nr:class I SAM-dependent methyltransferase [Thermoanaerobaculia bacterium]
MTPRIEDFLDEPTRRLEDWRWLFREDRPFPVRSHRGPLGKLLVILKRLLRPVVRLPQNDLWERQRVFNIILLEHLQKAAHEERLTRLESFLRDGLDEVMRHNDALFSRVDQKLDRHRREVRQLVAALGAALARVEEGAAEAGGAAGRGAAAELTPALQEAAYVAFEARFRGSEEEIRGRLADYLPRLAGKGPVLDLGCGRGEALALLAGAGVESRGVDASAEMVAACRRRGLDAEQGDLLAALAATPAESLGAVVSFHVVEHLPPAAIDRLLRLAWGALRPGGVLLLETPNPLSLLVAAGSFWLDPTHVRPVHPELLRHLAEQAGFAAVERLDLRPFPEAERLPEISLADLPPELQVLADRVNRLRDRIDEALFGYQDYALIAEK